MKVQFERETQNRSNAHTIVELCAIRDGIANCDVMSCTEASKLIGLQWRIEGGAGGGICPRSPPGGGRQNPAKDFFKIYIRRNF